MSSLTPAALTAVQTLHQIGVQAEEIAARVAQPSDAPEREFAAAVGDLHELKLTAQATAVVWQTLDDLAETLLSQPRH